MTVKFDNKKRPSYNRIGRKITTSINPIKNTVVTVRLVSDKEIKTYNLKKVGKKYVKNN